MCELHDFEARIQRQFAQDSRPSHWTSEEAEELRKNIGVHRQRFEHLASHLLEAVVRPRLDILGSYFPLADIIENASLHQCACWIGYTRRVPATTKVIVTLEHDVCRDHLVVCYDVRMTPVLLKSSHHDALTVAFSDVEDVLIAEWLEERLLKFLVAFLQIEDFEGEAGTEHGVA